EGDDLVQHARGYRQPRAKDRSGEAQRQIGADTGSLQKVAEVGVRVGALEAMKGYALVDAFGDRLPLDSFELRAGQPLAWCEAAVKDQFVAWRCHPIDCLEHFVSACPAPRLPTA